LLDGVGVDRNERHAVILFRGAAAQGNADGHYRYGLCLRDGIGTPPNTGSATDQFKTAMNQGHRLASEAYDQLVHGDRRQVRPRPGGVNQDQVSPAAGAPAGQNNRCATDVAHPAALGVGIQERRVHAVSDDRVRERRMRVGQACHPEPWKRGMCTCTRDPRASPPEATPTPPGNRRGVGTVRR
jgi:hypothetical protein